jgi:hypothetical protein
MHRVGDVRKEQIIFCLNVSVEKRYGGVCRPRCICWYSSCRVPKVRCRLGKHTVNLQMQDIELS